MSSSGSAAGMDTGVFSSLRKSSAIPEGSSPCHRDRLSRRQFNKGLLQTSSIRLWSLPKRAGGTEYPWNSLQMVKGVELRFAELLCIVEHRVF